MTSSAVGGIRFGQYTLLRRIARGGMAEVFLAQQKGLEGFDRRVAIKRILPHLTDAPDFVKMFLGEAKLAAQLTHPNVVHIYDFGKHDGDYFIAMEYVEGVHAGQLYKFGVDVERLPPTLVARIGADAATALHYAHEARGNDGKPIGLVHRDVSPANIMVSYDGVVKLCDFGIAKAAALGEQLTNPGQVKGKYAYMSPEQTIAAPLDGRSDVFSLAIVLWELLAGKTIVGRGDAVDAMRAIRDGKLPSIATVAPKTPPALVKALTWAMQTRRETRATAMDFAQALEAFIKSSPELATPMQLGGWIRTRFPREGLTDQRVTPGVSIGTRASPGTLLAHETPESALDGGTVVSEGTQAAMDTSASQLIAASRHDDDDFADDLESAETVQLSDEDNPFRRNATVERNAESVIIDEPRARAVLPSPRRSPTSAPLGKPRSPSSEMTAPRGPIYTGSPSTEMTAMTAAGTTDVSRLAATGVLTETRGPDSTTERGMRAASEAPYERGPFSANEEVTHRGPPRRPSALQTLLARLRVMLSGLTPERRRNAIAIGALGGIAVLSFVIALAAKSCGSAPPPKARVVATPVTDAGAPTVGSGSGSMTWNGVSDASIAVDAATPDAAVATITVDAVVDPEHIEIEPVDDGGVPSDVREPTIQTSVLEVRTKPTGGAVRVSTIDEVRVDPARFALPPGQYVIIAEFPGYLLEERDVVMERGVDVVQEIVFTRKKAGRVPPKTGKLTARTTPYSTVLLDGKPLGETPFAERALPVGTYTLTFTNPDKAPVTRKVTITANKTTKISFAFP